jgi:hypothetical protein
MVAAAVNFKVGCIDGPSVGKRIPGWWAELAGGMQAGRRGYCCFFEFFPKL